MGKKHPRKTVALTAEGKGNAIESSRGRVSAGGDLHGSEKPGWSVGDMEKQPGDEMKNNNKMKNNKMK